MYEIVITNCEILPLIDERIATLAKGARVIYSSSKKDSISVYIPPFHGHKPLDLRGCLHGQTDPHESVYNSLQIILGDIATC